MIQYKDGGLRNVWLANGYEVRMTRFGEAVAIHDQEGLTKAVCLALTKKPSHMTGAEFRYVRSAGMLASQSALGHLLDVDAQTVARWEKDCKVPRWADKLLRLLYAAHAEGNVPIRRVMERTNQVERLVNQKIVIQESRKGWESTIEDCDQVPA
ncbi:helix-turn-helix domain-containing protein [Brachymonas denitrificans]|jgi:DNA-binding transcriptional regulator YiaG|uniref:helix-turn-helix domain-containing protein n=1 Tax=Brachymonas denitrificans TaxID=28220 RepID=UPI001BCDBE04|nr:hypothetical protein [Brachymonas denitrificans]